MRQVLLDTHVLIDLVFERSAAVGERFSAAMLAGDALYLSAISLFEYRFGAERSRRRLFQLEALTRFLSAVSVIDFDAADAERAALVEGLLFERGRIIGGYDLLIASQAIERDLIVATGNQHEFSRVDGLSLEDWRTPA